MLDTADCPRLEEVLPLLRILLDASLLLDIEELRADEPCLVVTRLLLLLKEVARSEDR